jgi:hypothetical protein
MLCYHETRTRVVHDGRGTYSHNDVAVTVADDSHFAFASASTTQPNLIPILLLFLFLLLWRLMALNMLTMCLLPLILRPQLLLLLILASSLLALPPSPSSSIQHPQFPHLIVSKMPQSQERLYHDGIPYRN